MKKFLLIIAFVVGMFAIQAQTVKSYMYPAGTYTKTYTADGLFYNTRVKVSDKTTGAAGVGTVKLQGKYFDTDSYSDITTVTWTGVGSTDSIISFQNVSTKNYYRYLKILVTRTGGLIKVDYIKNSFKK